MTRSRMMEVVSTMTDEQFNAVKTLLDTIAVLRTLTGEQLEALVMVLDVFARENEKPRTAND